MLKKPFNKDIPSFIRDGKNWVTMWRSPEAKLRIDRLKHTTITRLVREQVYRFYTYMAEPEDDVIAYDFHVKAPSEYKRFNFDFIETQPNQAATIQAVNNQWGIVHDD